MAAYRGRRDYGGGWWSASGGSGRMTLAAVMATRAPRPAFIRREAIRAAEAAADEVVLRVQPTEEAERTRQGIIGYLKLLFGTALGCEVRSPNLIASVFSGRCRRRRSYSDRRRRAA